MSTVMTRRNALLASAAAAAVTTCALVPIAAKAAVDPDNKLIALERDLEAARAEVDSNHRAWGRAYNRLPEWARDGWPQHEADSFLIKSMGFGAWRAARRPTLEHVREFNAHTESIVVALREEWGKRRAEGRQRVKEWIARRREQLALRAEADAIEARQELLFDRIAAIETAIRDTPAHGMTGLLVKMRLCAHYHFPDYETRGLEIDDPDFHDEIMVSAILDCERLAQVA